MGCGRDFLPTAGVVIGGIGAPGLRAELNIGVGTCRQTLPAEMISVGLSDDHNDAGV
jgi:hypothetical protein